VLLLQTKPPLGLESHGAVSNLIAKIKSESQNAAVCVFGDVKFAKARDCRAEPHALCRMRDNSSL
jgi:hypothetical protein